MLAWELTHRVDIELPTTTQDTITGETTTVWASVLRSVPAQVLTGPGREFMQSGAVQSEVSARINIRWFPGLLPTMRILWDGHTYNIHSIETDATGRREWRLKCTDGVNDG